MNNEKQMQVELMMKMNLLEALKVKYETQFAELKQQIEGLKQDQQKIKELEDRIANASMILADWDGEYDPETGKGSVKGLAEVVELAYTALQGESWRKESK